MNLCEKCLAIVPNADEFCPECGAPMSEGKQSSDVEVYPLLARANLFRMRGEYKQAEDVCLGILRRFPNNASANTLLGDIAAEHGDIEQAAEWYELAIDLVPDSKADREKLAFVRARMAERQAASTATQLGLKRPANIRWITSGLIVFLSVVGVVAYLVGVGAGRKDLAKGSGVSLEAPAGIQGEPSEKTITGPVVKKETGSTSGNLGWRPKEDADLTALLLAKSGGNLLVDASQDPRTGNIRLTFLAEGEADVRSVAKPLVAAAFEFDSPEFLKPKAVIVRALKDGKLIYVASVDEADFTLVQSQVWQDEHKEEPDLVLSTLFKSEWRPAPVEPAAEPPRPQ